MNYRTSILRTAQKDLRRLDSRTVRRVLLAIDYMAKNCAEWPHEALKGQWSGAFRLRVGDYRVVYTVHHDSQLIVVHFVRHRRDVYR